MFKTSHPKINEIEKKWFVVDADGVVLGRLASQVATILRGKHKPEYMLNMDAGDFVVIVNADKIRLTGKKSEMKNYFFHSGYIGSEKFISYREMMEKHPERVVERAVKGMLPHNTLGRAMFKKLKVYKGADHPHQAQQPEPLKLEG